MYVDVYRANKPFLDVMQCRHVCHHPAGVIKLLWHPTEPIVYSCTVEVLDMAFIPAFGGNPVAGLLTASDDESVRLFSVNN
jgi:hypothetical protein